MGELDDKIWIWTTEVRSELESVHVICGMLFHSEENKYCRNMQNDVLKYVVLWSLPRPQAPPEKSGKGPGSVCVYFLSTITSQNFEEPIRLQNETTRNVIPSHAHKAKSTDYAIW